MSVILVSGLYYPDRCVRIACWDMSALIAERAKRDVSAHSRRGGVLLCGSG